MSENLGVSVNEAEDEEKEKEEEEEAASKPLPSFGTALQRFTFASVSPSRPQTRSQSRYSHSPSPQKRTAPAPATTDLSPSKSTRPPTSTSSTPGPRRKRQRGTGYAPPGRYAHLSGIADALTENLICVFIGINPGIRTAETGHAYSAPSNLFWKLLHLSGLTPDCRRLPREHLALPELYSFGNTNLVPRPTRDQAELSPAEMEDCVPMLEAKIRRWRPEAVCIVGKGIWERIFKVKSGRKLGKDCDFHFGWQDPWRLGDGDDGSGSGSGSGGGGGGGGDGGGGDGGGGDGGGDGVSGDGGGDGVSGDGGGDGWQGARVFVAISTSGLVAGYSMDQKVAVMKELGDWVAERRRQRGESAPRGMPDEVVEEAARQREAEHRMRIRQLAETPERGKDGDS